MTAMIFGTAIDNSMTEDQLIIAVNLYDRCTMLPGSWDKRFAAEMYSLACLRVVDLTPKQDEWLYRLLYKYRAQLPTIYKLYKNHKYCRRKEPREQEAKPAPSHVPADKLAASMAVLGERDDNELFKDYI